MYTRIRLRDGFEIKNAQKSGCKLREMKKNGKKNKNFSKGYLQNGFYMVNYEKFKVGDRAQKKALKQALDKVRKSGEIHTKIAGEKRLIDRGSRSGKDRYY